MVSKCLYSFIVSYLLWILRQKNWTSFSLFSSWSSMNLQWEEATMLDMFKAWIWSCPNYYDVPGGGSLSKKLHQTTLHHQPKASWHVEDNSQKYEVKWNPLVVWIVDNSIIAVILVKGRKYESTNYKGRVAGGLTKCWIICFLV